MEQLLDVVLDIAYQAEESIVFDIEVGKSGFDALKTALDEMNSATGVSAGSIKALEARYKDISDFDVYKLFDKTASGIYLNADYLRDLENECRNIFMLS